VRVAARRAEEGQRVSGAGGRQYVEVSVTDTGIGISPAHQERIFEEFEQIPDPARPPQEGTGLGLALVKKLVQMHGGNIRVTSAIGQGSTFAFTIPVSDE